jgi:hypothetical protein
MEVLRCPANCEICRGKLKGGALIEIEREEKDYFLKIEQPEKCDWGLCPRCKRIACFATCWDADRGYCTVCPSFESVGACPKCRKELIGTIEIINIETEGIPTILMRETPDRYWIQCDLCGLVVCKACCKNPKSGYCNRCLARIRKDNPSESIKIQPTTTFRSVTVVYELDAESRNQKSTNH